MKLLSGLLLLAMSGSAFSGADSLVGRYAHYDVVAYTENLWGPLQMRNVIVSYGLTDIEKVGNQFVSIDRFCFSEYKANLPFVAKVPDDFTRAIIPKKVTLEVTENDHGVHVYRPETPTFVGVDLDDEDADLPENVEDPRYYRGDDDHDGHPGVTVFLEGLGGFFDEQLYIARKEIFAYHMNQEDDGSLVGVVEDHSQQKVVGASKPQLVTDRNPPQDPDLTKSPIILVPVANDMDCEEMRELRNDLFPASPNP